MKPQDIDQLVSVGPPTLAPDGATIVFATTQPDLDEDTYRSRLWTVAVDGGAPPRELTHGVKDRAPAFSPDGRWIAFLRTEPKGKSQVHLLPTDGGDARALTSLDHGAGDPIWSPDSMHIAFLARVPEPGRHGTDDKIGPEKEPPRRITTLQYQQNGEGYVIDQPQQVFVVAVGGGEAVQVTYDATDCAGVSWSPDGQWLAFTGRDPATSDRRLVTDAYVIRPDGSDRRRLTDGTLAIEPTAFADERTLLLGAADPGPGGDRLVARQDGLWKVDLAEGGPPVRLTDEERWTSADATVVPVAGSALMIAQQRGEQHVLSVPVDGSEPTLLDTGFHQVTGVDSKSGVTVMSYKDPSTHGEIGVITDGGVRRLTSFSEHLVPRPIEDLTATAADGQALHGFVVTPDGPGPHPVLLMIHGGPFTQYGWTLFDEAQVYAGAGYAVVYTNPRGSSGYGQAYGQWILGDVGERSAADLLTLLDTALERPDLDGSRLGVLGGSHGGFMTTWLIGHTDRFKAAVSERAVNAIDSFEGSSDIGFAFGDDLYGPDPEGQRRQSPLTYVDAITTPVLIIHSEDDLRCPLEQAQRLFVALRKRDRVAELLIFPGENHELSRTGLPSHRVARFEAIVEWFARWL